MGAGQDDTLLVEADVNPKDIAFIHPGQEVMVKLTAYDFAIYGGLKGRVEHIGADTVKNENGERFYKVRIRTDNNYLEKDGKKLPISVGMVAVVDIVTNRKTVMDYLLKPVLKAKDMALTER